MKIYDAWAELKEWLSEQDDSFNDHDIRTVIRKMEELEIKHE